MVVYPFNLGTQEAEAEAGTSLNSRPTWTYGSNSGQPGLHSQTLSLKKIKESFLGLLAKIKCKKIKECTIP